MTEAVLKGGDFGPSLRFWGHLATFKNIFGYHDWGWEGDATGI